MDLKKLAGSLLSSDAISGLGSLTGASGSDVTSVLTSALPSLLSGANEQAHDSNTSEGFVNALSQHAKDDTSNLTSFLGKVDLTDGSKIISHLLGSNESSVVKNVAKEAGVSQKQTSSILSAAAPLLMSLLGQQADDDKDSGLDIGGLLGGLVDNVDVGSLLTGLLGGGNSSSSSSGNEKPAKKKNAAGGLLGGLMNLLKK